MKILDKITRAEFSWFDLVFILIVFTVTHDERVPSALSTVIFFAAGAVVGWEHVWLRRMIGRRKLREMAARRRAA